MNMENMNSGKTLGVGWPAKGQQGGREGLLKAFFRGSTILREVATVMREMKIFRMFYCMLPSMVPSLLLLPEFSHVKLQGFFWSWICVFSE